MEERNSFQVIREAVRGQIPVSVHLWVAHPLPYRSPCQEPPQVSQFPPTRLFPATSCQVLEPRLCVVAL